MASELYVLVKSIEFTNGAKQRFPVAFFTDKAVAERASATEHAELKEMGQMLVGVAFPDGSFEPKGKAEVLFAAMGIKGIHVGIVKVPVVDSAIVLPEAPRIIVPG
jgi:hypothetical protein